MSESKAPPLPSWWNNPSRQYSGELRAIVEAMERWEPDAVARLTLRALQGDAAAAELLGNAFLDGYRVWPSWERARQWLRFAADRGHTAAQRQYATLLLEDDQSRDTPDEATRAELVSYLASAADAGDLRALVGLGTYKLHLDVPDERAAGVQMLECAAAHGNGTAMQRLASCYVRGTGVERDVAVAYGWAALAHRHGHPCGTITEVWMLSQLTDEQIAAAEQRAEAWQPAVT